MDCQTFDSSLLDAIYDELDAPTSTAMVAHADGCASCAARIARLKKTRELLHPSFAEAVALPEGLEARILAATTSAMDDAPATRAPAKVVALSERRGVVAAVSKPQLAIAAAFVLVLGASALLAASSTRESAPVAASAPGATPASDVDDRAAAASAIAMAEPAPPPPTMAAQAPHAPAEVDSKSEAKTKTAAPGFAQAKSLYDSGQYAAALPRFQALAEDSPEAELFLARCLVQTKGCAAADPHFDSAARRSDDESASHMRLEAARCYKNAGQAVAARNKYDSLKADPYVASDASRELAGLTAKGAVHAASAAATHAAPPATKPAAKVDRAF